ncbi:MAG: NAD(P)-binding domain-containing protein [Thermonemataceae bacterium]|nr:NAD(P)-binding domain-containing protein [Thermonemataceae bacterium]
MKIAVLGTGVVGVTIATKLVELGHQVMLGARSKENEKALDFVEKNKSQAQASNYAEAAAFGELLFNCTKGEASIEALLLAGEENMKDKVLIDIANPLDFSQGMPPTLSVLNTSSLAEMIQAKFPEVKVVKALNTMWCGIMVNPQMIGDGEHHTFVSGNDKEAKMLVRQILVSFGWKETNIIDLGDISTARGTEMYLPLWLRLYAANNSAAFNIKIVS